tara:strand:+ start:697 stop:2181 length:1485 start_codon:yes stop_codon:yes gene_type:complete
MKLKVIRLLLLTTALMLLVGCGGSADPAPFPTATPLPEYDTSEIAQRINQHLEYARDILPILDEGDFASESERIAKGLEAISHLDQAIYLDPLLYKAYEIKGLIYKDIGMCEISVIASTMAINLNPKGIDGYLDRMECYRMLGDFDLALNDGLTILANFPPRDEYFEKYVEELRELVEKDKVQHPYPTYTPMPSTPMSPKIQLINLSSYPTDDIEEWIALAESKMKSRKSRIFTFIYPVGEMKKPEKLIVGTKYAADAGYREYEILLSQDEIETILGEIELWLQGDSCVREERKKQALSDYRIFLEKGANTSFQHTLCETTRVVMMAIRPGMRDHEPLENFQDFLAHELYHAFQQDLDDRGECRRRQNESEYRNSVWVVEGGAHYFATWLVAEIHGRKNYRSQILDIAYHTLEREGELVYDHTPDKWGAAALSLMVEHDMITEESILDGSLFHNCARELEFDHNSPEIQHIKNSWYLIEQNDGVFQFKQEALDK